MQHITAARRAAITQLLLLCTVLTAPAAVRAEARGVFAADSFQADTTLAVAKNRRTGPNHTVGPVPAGAAWDGANLWTAAGGATDTVNLMLWSKSGKSVKAAHTPKLDIRAIWTQSQGPEAPLYADAYDDDNVYVRKQDGTFEPTGVSLHGASKDTDSPVLFRPNALTDDPAAGVLVAHDGAGTLLEFDASDGQFFRDVPLNGYGSEPGETDWPAYTRFAVAAGLGPGDERFYYLTYAGGRVHAWDSDGVRAGGATLEKAGEDEMSCHSWSFANGRAWVYDSETGSWKGYKLSFEAPKPKAAAAARSRSGQRAAADAVHGAPDSGLAVPQAGVGGDKETCPLAVE